MSNGTPSPNQFQVQPVPGVTTVSPDDASFVQLINDALAGGDAVYDFFSGHFQALQALYETIATGGDEVWIDGTDDTTGLPVTYVAEGSNFITVGHQFTDTTPLEDGTGSTTTYKPVGVTYVTFTTDQGTSQMVLNSVHYAGLGLGGLLTAPVLGKVALSLIKSVANWLKAVCQKIYQRVSSGGGDEDPDDAEDQVESDAGDAAAESGEQGAEIGEGIFADVTISVAQGVAFAVGIGIMAVVLILQLLAKQISAQVRFYNLTGIDVTFGVCQTSSHTAMSGGPAAVGQTVTVPKVSPATAPPWVTTTDTGLYYAEATFVNSNELAGVAYVLDAEPSGDFPGFRAFVDIPIASTNSLGVSFSDESCDQYWQSHEQDPDPDYGLTATATSGNYTLSIATNANSGQTPSPLSGAVGYNYEHLVVLSDGSVS